MTKQQAPFRVDHVGSFLRPKELVEARAKFASGEITHEELTAVEDKDEVIARIKEASQYVPLENLYLSTQCGFASTEEGNVIKEEDQWKKIALISEIAREVWGE